jgi:lon-related putative ATP-dependent protease
LTAPDDSGAGFGARAAAFELAPSSVAFSIEPRAVEEALSSAAESGGAEWGREIIGQPRALEALRMGVRVRAKGYNVHVSGAPGTGRRTAVLRVLAEEAIAADALRDIAYVYNFASPLEPMALVLPAGGGKAFKADLHRMVESLKRVIRLQAESAAALPGGGPQREYEERENRLLTALEDELLADGFKLVQVEAPGGPAMDIVPVIAPKAAMAAEPTGSALNEEEPRGPASEENAHTGAMTEAAAEPVSFENSSAGFEALQAKVSAGELDQAVYDEFRRRWYGHMDRMKKLFAELRKGQLEAEAQAEELRARILAPQVAAEAALLAEKWPDPKLRAWVAELEKDVLSHLFVFSEEAEAAHRRKRSPALARYGANVVVDRSGQEKAPVVVERHPSVATLFGSVESRPDEGDLRSAYLRIRAGSFLLASGGFLVLKAEDVLADEETWHRLKRALLEGTADILCREGPAAGAGWLKPEAPKVSVKVIMIGGESSYDILYQADPEFQKLFKVHAELDSSMPMDASAIRDYAAFASRVCRDEGLLALDPSGLGAVIEQGARLAEYRNRLSTRFGAIADLLRESDYRAHVAGAAAIGAAEVREAVRARARLANLPEEKIEDMIATGEIILQASGTAVGRVNGLAVHDRGYFAFGLPAVISAQVSPGEGGVINIEGESGLSGEIYDKAVLIVEGFLRSRYARDFPLAVTASICFEQSYTAVEGDSASSTAVYALLSAIADVPLRQDIAVTGSLNQVGQVQPVGGVNEKIEGFFRVCRQAGLSRTQGVMIPRRNVVNLTLSREVQEAVAAGDFHVWAVSTIDEGIAVLTGMEAGSVDARGDFPPGSFNGRVRRELLRMARTVKSYMG